MKLYKKIGFIFLIASVMTACGAGSEKWKEEVQLSNGKVIVIERELVLESGGAELASNRDGVSPKENLMRFPSPDGSGKMIEWHSTKMDVSIRPEFPLILDMESGRPVVFTNVFNAVGCNVYSKYNYQNGTWDEEILPPTFEQRSTNLFIFRSKDKQAFINLEAKRKNISDTRSSYAAQVGPANPDCSHL